MRPASLSLRTRLLRQLGWPLLTVLLLSGVYDYVRALERARSDQDLALERIAIALASRLDLDADDKEDNLAPHLHGTVEAIQRADGMDLLYFMATGERQGLIGGDQALSSIVDRQARQDATFVDHQFNGQDVRVVTYPHLSPIGQTTVVVAQTTRRRDDQARLVLFDTLTPNVVLLVLALLLVRRAVTQALRPLDELSSAFAVRHAEDLSPVTDLSLPKELVPVIKAINQLVSNLRNAAQMQQTFLSNAAHQLRTPLAGIQTQIELALREDPSVPQHRERLSAVDAALRRLARSTHQMLALARSGPQAVTVDAMGVVDLQVLLEEAASTWLDTALQAGVDLGFEASPAKVWGSAWMLGEALNNMVHNAIRHSPRDGKVTVRCGTDAQGAGWLSVEDEGPGIALSERARVFERFYQAAGAASGGSGLGLAIVREVAQRHGASVTLADPPSGRGLLLTIRIPTDTSRASAEKLSGV